MTNEFNEDDKKNLKDTEKLMLIMINLIDLLRETGNEIIDVFTYYDNFEVKVDINMENSKNKERFIKLVVKKDDIKFVDNDYAIKFILDKFNAAKTEILKHTDDSIYATTFEVSDEVGYVSENACHIFHIIFDVATNKEIEGMAGKRELVLIGKDVLEYYNVSKITFNVLKNSENSYVLNHLIDNYKKIKEETYLVPVIEFKETLNTLKNMFEDYLKSEEKHFVPSDYEEYSKVEKKIANIFEKEFAKMSMNKRKTFIYKWGDD